ncbi:MAG: hypothetical protein ACRD6R_01360 [Candidatus Polarisedimenticolia bacterium]
MPGGIRPPGIKHDGLAVLPGFLRDHEVEEAGALVDLLRRDPPHAGCARPHNTLLPMRWNDPLVRLVLDSNPRIIRLVEAVSAADLRWISGYVSIKEAQSPPL